MRSTARRLWRSDASEKDKRRCSQILYYAACALIKTTSNVRLSCHSEMYTTLPTLQRASRQPTCP
jgi:hypothetical protein